MKTTAIQIEEKVKGKEEGTIFFTEDFLSFGSYEAVRKVLQRLQKKRVLERVAQGIYVRPKINSYIGVVMPTAEEVAKAVVRRDRARTIPTGTAALNALNLSTQVPMNIVLLTDGSAREIKVGKRTIRFKKTSPRNLAVKGWISGLAIQALKTIGKESLTPEQEEKILLKLQTEQHNDLVHDIALAPQWIQQIMKKVL